MYSAHGITKKEYTNMSHVIIICMLLLKQAVCGRGQNFKMAHLRNMASTFIVRAIIIYCIFTNKTMLVYKWLYRN